MECDAELKTVILTSCEYGLRFFSCIQASWKLLLLAQQDGSSDKALLQSALQDTDAAWKSYEKLPEEYPAAATLYRGKGWQWPGKELPDGLSFSIEEVRSAIAS